MEEFKCEICGREFKTLGGFSIHIPKIHKIKTEKYYLKYINPNKYKCKCGCFTTFINLKDGYKKFCSLKCSNKSEETKNKSKETCMKKYGCENPNQNEEVKNKKKETCMKKYGCENPNQNEEVRNKSKETCKKNFGVEYPSQNKEIRNKQKETCKKNFGFEHAIQNKEVRTKSKETCKKNFGVEYPSQNKEIRNKQKETCKKNFGVEYPIQNKEIKNKSKETCKKNFGCEYSMQNRKIAKKVGDKNKLNFEKVKERYPDLVKIEELISGPNGEILGHCKNSNCKNSKENGGYFELSVSQIWYRNLGINSIKDGDYIYCCEECKQSCPLFGKSSSQLHSINNENPQISYTPQEYSTFKSEVFSRQLLENTEHTLNYCEKCHSTENLQVHHIQPQKLEPGYALDPPNGLILCQKCHFEIGHEKGSECSTGNLANTFCK